MNAAAHDPFTELPDPELARRIAAGDEAALRVLMRRHNQTLHRTARSILKEDADAEDAVQEAWILAYRSIGGFRGEARLSTWLVRIVVNESIGRLRKRNRHAGVVHLVDDGTTAGDAPDQPGLPEREAMRSEARRLLEARIDALPDVFRTVFMLRGIEEFTVEEVAIALGIPEATVRTRYFRARGLLRESIAREIDTGFEEAFAFDGERCDRMIEHVLARLHAASVAGT
ncbi:MAG: RNA polymerase sigma factor [Steroidobacteraceae bacterium]